MPSRVEDNSKEQESIMSDKSSCILPVSRIRTIMKSSPEVSNISQESLFLIGKATELFVGFLAKRTLRRSPDKKHVDYNTLAELVDDDDTLQFLIDIIPTKMTVKEFHQWESRQKKIGSDSDEEGTSKSSQS